MLQKSNLRYWMPRAIFSSWMKIIFGNQNVLWKGKDIFQCGCVQIWLSAPLIDLTSVTFLLQNLPLLGKTDQLVYVYWKRQLTNFDWFFFDTRMSCSISFLQKCISSNIDASFPNFLKATAICTFVIIHLEKKPIPWEFLFISKWNQNLNI